MYVYQTTQQNFKFLNKRAISIKEQYIKRAISIKEQYIKRTILKSNIKRAIY